MYLTLLLLVPHSLYAQERNFIQCDVNEFCEANIFPYSNPTSIYSQIRDDVFELIRLNEVVQNITVAEFASNFTRFSSIRKWDILCQDSFTPFLLDLDWANHSLSCVWTGEEQKGACVPVPPRFSSGYHFMHGPLYKEKLMNFRNRIGCSIIEMSRGQRLTELHICNENCFQGGIDYLMTLIIITVGMFACFRNCIIN